MISEQYLARLLSLISHEVRGPLGVIRGYLRLLEQQGALADGQRQAVSAAMRASDRATDILGQVSALARLESGDVVPAFSPTPVSQLLEATAKAVTLPAQPVVTLQLGAMPETSVAVDKALLSTALASLTSAVIRAQASDAGVSLLAREEDEGAQRGVTITITAMERVSAASVDRPLDLARGGLGLDLPIAVFIIRAHSGQVSERRINERLAAMVVWLPTA